jgi:hypothetical protein
MQVKILHFYFVYILIPYRHIIAHSALLSWVFNIHLALHSYITKRMFWHFQIILKKANLVQLLMHGIKGNNYNVYNWIMCQNSYIILYMPDCISFMDIGLLRNTMCTYSMTGWLKVETPRSLLLNRDKKLKLEN